MIEDTIDTFMKLKLQIETI